MSTLRSPSHSWPVFSCSVTARSTLRVGAQEIPALRKNPGTPPQGPLAPNYLKHADEQTVLALAAVLRAIEQLGWAERTVRSWGVLAAPTFMGRAATAQTIERFRQEGAWGVSPHVIPQNSLHAVSGTISQALGLRGPNFGVSGGPQACSEAFLAAGTMLLDSTCPGLWIVLTGYDREVIPDSPGDYQAQAAALALTGSECGQVGRRLHIHPGQPARPLQDFSLSQFVDSLEERSSRSAQWSLPGLGWVELETQDQRVETYA